MTKGIYNSFSKATCDVLKLMFNLEAQPNAADKINSASEENVVIVIGLTGDLSGKVSYLFPKNTAIGLVHILSGMDFSEIDEFVTSAIGEVGNIISGNALSALSEQQIVCDILPPQIKIGESDTPEGEVCRVSTDVGNIDFWITV